MYQTSVRDELHSCREGEHCVGSFNCELRSRRIHRIQHEYNPDKEEAKKCMPDFGSIKFVCCKKKSSPQSSLQFSSLEVTTSPSQISDADKYSENNYINGKTSTSLPELVTGTGFPSNFDHDTRTSYNPYGTQKPIYLVSPTNETETVPSTNTSENISEVTQSEEKVTNNSQEPDIGIEVPYQGYQLPSLESENFSGREVSLQNKSMGDQGEKSFRTVNEKNRTSWEIKLQTYNPPPPVKASSSESKPSAGSTLEEPATHFEQPNDKNKVQEIIPSEVIQIPSQGYELPPLTNNIQLPQNYESENSTVSINSTEVPTVNLDYPTSNTTGLLNNYEVNSTESTLLFSSQETYSTVRSNSDDFISYNNSEKIHLPVPSQQNIEPDPLLQTKNENQELRTVQIPSQSYSLPPVTNEEVPVEITEIRVPSQDYEPPPFTKEENERPNTKNLTVSLPSQNHVPPPLEALENDNNTQIQTHTSNTTEGGENGAEEFGIRGSFVARQRFVNKCPDNMKCLRESYCQVVNPNEGSVDVFDIRIGTSLPERPKCRQANLPVDGVCCYLREDFAASVSSKIMPLPITDLDSVPKKVNPEDICGIKRPNMKRQAGDGTTFAEFPWHALLIIGSRRCSGVIVSRKAIVTASSCIKNVKMDSIRIRVGEWDQSGENEPKKHQDLKVASIHNYPLSQNSKSSNLALIFTQSEIAFDYHISKICLPQPVETFEGMKCLTTGWGSANLPSRVTERHLKQTSLQILSRTSCEQRIRNADVVRANYGLPQSSSCAIRIQTPTTCSVDEGSPLICENENTGEFLLAGILSHAVPIATCGNLETPLVYTNISQAVQWIHSSIN